jgi:CubicO group peptidase (beta-lactamase class C family)
MENRFARYARLPLDARFDSRDVYELREAWGSPRFGGAKDVGLYAYTHLSEFLPCAVIDPGAAPSPLAVDLRPDVLDMVVETRYGPRSGSQLLADPLVRLRGFIALHRGRIVAEAYPGMGPRDRHVWMSVAKTWGGLLAAREAAAGRLDEQGRLEDLVPEFAGTAWVGVTVRDLLDMATGMDIEETLPSLKDPMAPTSRFFAAEFGEPDAAGRLRTHNEVLLTLERLEPPGQVARYSSVVTNVLGLVLEAVSGRRIAALVQDVWAAMGAERAATLALSPQGQAAIHGLFSSTLRDLGRYGLLHTPSWSRVAAEPQAPTDYLHNLRTRGRPEIYPLGDLGPRQAEAFREVPRHNAYQWDSVFEDGDMFKGGLNGQGLYVSPSRDVVIAWFGINRDGIGIHPVARAMAKALGG